MWNPFDPDGDADEDANSKVLTAVRFARLGSTYAAPERYERAPRANGLAGEGTTG